MPDAGQSSGSSRRAVEELLFGRRDTRLRATWRTLLAYPVFWLVAGGVIAGNLQAVLPSLTTPWSGLLQSVLHGGAVLLFLVPWARTVERRPLSDFGVAGTPSWLGRFGLGLVATLAGYLAWYAVAAGVGTVTLTWTPRTAGYLGVGAVATVVALLFHVLVQQLAFFRIALLNAAEGLQSRGLTARRSLLGGVAVAVPLFVLMHQLPGGLRALDLAVVGTLFGLLYVQTGDLAIGTGLHGGTMLVGNLLFTPDSGGAALFTVGSSLPGVWGTLGGYGFPKLLVGYLLVLGWLVGRDTAGVDTGVLSPSRG